MKQREGGGGSKSENNFFFLGGGVCTGPKKISPHFRSPEVGISASLSESYYGRKIPGFYGSTNVRCGGALEIKPLWNSSAPSAPCQIWVVFMAVANKPYSPGDWNVVRRDLRKFSFHLSSRLSSCVQYVIFWEFLKIVFSFSAWLAWIWRCLTFFS